MYDGMFTHKCVEDDCPNLVHFDDEPRCFKHSPDEGSSVRGYSARRAADKKAQEAGFRDFETLNAQYLGVATAMLQVRGY